MRFLHFWVLLAFSLMELLLFEHVSFLPRFLFRGSAKRFFLGGGGAPCLLPSKNSLSEQRALSIF